MNDSKGTTKVFYTFVFRISIIKIFVLSFFTIVGSCQNLHSQNKDMKFKHLSLEEGLSQSVVTCILQDNRGFMWFGTEDGLNRFDGYEFRVFKSNVENQGSLSNNHVLVIYEDRSGMMWIGTNGGGLNKFDRFREEFTHYKNDPDNPKSLSNNYVRTIYEDRSGILWIGTDGGLNKLEMGNRNIFDAGERSSQVINTSQEIQTV